LRGAFAGVAGGLGAGAGMGLACGVAVYVMCGLGRGFLSAPRLLEAVRGGCLPGLLGLFGVVSGGGFGLKLLKRA
jgi:hypothetical protein